MNEFDEIPDITEFGKIAYDAYRFHAHNLSFDGRPLPLWEDLGAAVQSHWQLAGTAVIENYCHQAWAALDARQVAQLKHAVNYGQNFSTAGIPGDGQLKLLAKMANLFRWFMQ